jgi:SAM-dependent methyltransferase
MAFIYDHPEIYDLEHSGSERDIPFFVRLAQSHRPSRIVEHACGNGRITLPLAKAAAGWGASVTGVDTSPRMVAAAREADKDALVSWHEGDLTSWRSAEPCDFLFAACSSLSHLTTQQRQIAAWRNAFESLTEGGRFVVAEAMPDYQTLADGMKSPSRAALCLDGDFSDGERHLLRCRASRYRADLQLMRVRYFYDQFSAGTAGRFVDDQEAYVFFPGELSLLFQCAGFEIEAVWGDYEFGPLTHDSRVIILSGRRKADPAAGGPRDDPRI